MPNSIKDIPKGDTWKNFWNKDEKRDFEYGLKCDMQRSHKTKKGNKVGTILNETSIMLAFIAFLILSEKKSRSKVMKTHSRGIK